MSRNDIYQVMLLRPMVWALANKNYCEISLWHDPHEGWNYAVSGGYGETKAIELRMSDARDVYLYLFQSLLQIEYRDVFAPLPFNSLQGIRDYLEHIAFILENTNSTFDCSYDRDTSFFEFDFDDFDDCKKAHIVEADFCQGFKFAWETFQEDN